MLRRVLLGLVPTFIAGVALVPPSAVQAATSGQGPGLAPYPGRAAVQRMTGGEVTDQPVKLDVTGSHDHQARIDSVKALLKTGPLQDGGLTWDPATRKVIVRVVQPANAKSAAVDQVKSAVRAAADGLTVEFQAVRYSRAELEELARRLFDTRSQWAPGLKGAGGGWDPATNRVEVLVRQDTGQAAEWGKRIRSLNDARIVMRTFTPTGGPWTENRLDDSAPWTGGAWMHTNSSVVAGTSNSLCTMGFTWRKENVRYAGTAYHCGGTNWYNNRTFSAESPPPVLPVTRCCSAGRPTARRFS